MTARTVVITGACGGIGRATVDAFLLEGWTVVGIDRLPQPDDLDVSTYVQADLSQSSGIDVVTSALAGVDQLDALVNNAAVQLNEPLVTTSDEQWAMVMDTNVRAAFQMIRGFHRQLAASRGAVVNVSSVHAIATSPGLAVYAISKGALAALTRSASLELAAEGIRCNSVLPGAVLTPMLQEGLSRRPHVDGPSGNLEELISRTPLGFVADPAHIAPSIVFLADSDRSPYTTGQVLVVDGGATIRLGTE